MKTEWLSLQCRPCQNRGAESNARAFVMGPTPLSVVVCSNRLPAGSVEEMEQILTHELTHIYDVRHLKLNLLDCHSLAYSEIRAAREAECSPQPSSNSNSSNWIFGTTQSPYEQQQQCVQQKAVTATRNLFPHQAQACLDAALQAGALQDLRPFVDATSTTAPTAGSRTTNTSNDNHNHHNISGGGETATGRNTNKEPQQQQKPTPRQ